MSSTKKPGGKGQMKTDHLQSVSDKETDEAMSLGEEKPYHSERLPADPMKFLEMIENEISHVPDMTRFRKVDEFISMARRFSEKYGIEAEIYRKPPAVSVWLLFRDEVLDPGMKKDYIRLIDLADEMEWISKTQSMTDRCDYAVVLKYMTHRTYVNGRELY